ncbi:MAG: O-antigen ligase family protein [Planctomycetia bacterium]|nr:O-antigen ligase family protein [Planctomycetia bacterium]
MYFYGKFLGRTTLLITLLLAPWLKGGLEYSNQVYLYYGILASCSFAILCLFAERRHSTFFQSSWLFEVSMIPLLLGILFGFFQLLPLPATVLQAISPHKIELCHELVSSGESLDTKWEKNVLTQSEIDKIPQWSNQISVCSSETREQLALLILAVSAFLIAGILFDTEDSRRWFWIFLVGNGLLLALFCIATRANDAISFYSAESDYFGPFFNKNNGAGYLCLCFGAAFSFLTESCLIHKNRVSLQNHSYKRSNPHFVKKLNVLLINLEKISRLTEKMVQLIKQSFFPLLTCGIIFAAILASLSRGSSLAVIFGFLFGLVILIYKKNVRYGYLVSVLLLIILGFLFCAGLNDSIRKRIATLLLSDVNSNALMIDGRWKLWDGTIQTIKDFQSCGAGLGTYYLANRKNDPFLHFGSIGYNAENQWLETIVNAGYFGLFLAVWEFLLILITAFLLIKRTKKDSIFALGTGIIVLLISQAISGTFDFGLYLPANILLFAVLCGSFMNCFDLSVKKQNSFFFSEHQFRIKKVIRLSLLFLALLFCWNSLKEIQSIAEIREAKKLIRMPQQTWTLDPDLIDEWIQYTKTKVEKRQDDFKAHLFLADLWELRFRIAVWERFNSESFLETEKNSDKNEQKINLLWKKTQPLAWHLLITEKQKLNLNVYVQFIRNEPAVQKFLREALKEVLLARKYCPIHPATHYRLEIYLPLVNSTTLDEQRQLFNLYSKRTISLSPTEPRHLFLCGFCHLCSGDEKNGFSYWRKSLTCSTAYLNEMLSFIELNVPQNQWNDALDNFLPDSFDIVNESIKKYPLFKDYLLPILKKRLDQTPSSEKNAAYYLHYARWQMQTGNHSEAALCFEKAIELDSKESSAYYEFGLLLLDHPELRDSDLCEFMFKTYLVLKPHDPRGRQQLAKAKKLK